MKEHNKLVRDKIPEICRANGATQVVTRILDDDAAFLDALCTKLIEEAHELQETPVLKEMADVLEVLVVIAKQQGYTLEDIQQARKEKAEKCGGFDKRIFLIRTEGQQI